MTHKQRWAAISIAMYVIFVVAAIVIGFLNPSKIGLEWTIFWYFVVAALCYYFYFKNITYREIVYYAQQLGLHQDDLKALVPNLKETQDVPNPDHPDFFSPFAKVPINVVNVLSDKLVPMAEEQGIPLYK